MYLALCAWLWVRIRILNGGHFVFALDDPYIHLALSEGIARGQYGINPGEVASPSSSVIWPYLLAPFSRFAWDRQVPLLLNLFAGTGAAVLAAASVALWPPPRNEDGAGSAEIRSEESWRRAISTVALIFIGNLLGLTFIGMEHTLQVLFAGVGAWGIIACLRGRTIPTWCLAVVALGPLVRYENLGISLALAIALAGQRRPRRALSLLAVSIVPVLLFSAYLHHLGLPWVPTSVLVKSRVSHANGIGERGLMLIGDNFDLTFIEPQRILVLILFLTLAFLAWRDTERTRRFAFGGAAIATLLQLLIGRFGWFHRYEVYIVFFGALILLHVVHERPRALLGWYALGLLGCSFPYLDAFHDIVLASNQVYRQQFQTRRFVNDFYHGNVAVNDLGMVSYRRRPGMYVLDLWGLASAEAAEQKNKSTAWMGSIVRDHDVGLVVIYPLWFPPAPKDWTLLGELCLNDPPIVLGGACVSYYATPAASLPELQDSFADFVHTLPPGITVRVAGDAPLYR